MAQKPNKSQEFLPVRRLEPFGCSLTGCSLIHQAPNVQRALATLAALCVVFLTETPTPVDPINKPIKHSSLYFQLFCSKTRELLLSESCRKKRGRGEEAALNRCLCVFVCGCCEFLSNPLMTPENGRLSSEHTPCSILDHLRCRSGKKRAAGRALRHPLSDNEQRITDRFIPCQPPF